MEGKLVITRRFFKVMVPDFRENLNLPPAFCKKVKEEKSEWATVKSSEGTWKINVRRNREGVISFKDGWPNFVELHGLTIGDFVLFEHTGGMHFNAVIFDLTACEKEFPVDELKKGHEMASKAVNSKYHLKNTRREPGKESGISYHSENPYFISTMKPHHARKGGKVTIPAEFFRSNNLKDMSSVKLRDSHGKAWTVSLLIQKTGQLRCRMNKGWHDFYVSSNLRDGDVCVFDLCRRGSSSFLMDVLVFPAPL